ncbi:MAG: hypothetical protein D6694_08655 [Gammaproteobacteria bacterium]|nr:MAG: hypothetical protein D6694_08655 [Gammaproteobacteria bacterium]
MLVFQITPHGAAIIEALFPCTNTPREGVVCAKSTGSRSRPKILERYYRKEDRPTDIRLKIHFPGKPKPICFFLEKIENSEELPFISHIEVNEHADHFEMWIGGHDRSFLFPKESYNEETIARIRRVAGIKPDPMYEFIPENQI